MTWGDVLHYITLGNPFSQAVLTTGSAVLKGHVLRPKENNHLPLESSLKPLKLWEISGGHYQFIRLAGLSGATAVILGAYGKHILGNISNPIIKEEAKNIFDTAHRFHFMHSLAFLAVPLCRRPILTGTLIAAGTILFSGPMYYRALTGDKTFIQVSTCGGFCLIAAWLSLIF